MTDLAWIVALLSPRDIALHPNFRSQEQVTAPSLLALLTTSQSGRYGQERGSEEIPDLVALDPLGMEMVDAVRTALEVGTVAEGAVALERIASGDPRDKPALRVAAAVIASSCYAELDRLNDAVRVLETLSVRISESRDDNVGKLLSAILSVNLALRARDAGGDSTTLARVASEALQPISVESLPAIQLSSGVGWTSATTMRNIVALLDESCAAHIADADPEFEARLQLVRRQASTLSQRRLGRAGAAMDKFMKKAFDEVVGTGSNTWSIGGVDGDEELVEGLFIAEFSGSPYANFQRSLLGTFRFLEGRSSKQDWQIREGLRLLRQGHDNKRLEPALRLVRREGPLAILRDEAIQILRNRVESQQIGDVEVAVLKAGSDVLGPQTAADGVRLLLSMRLHPPGVRAGRWQHGSSWYEATVRAARELSSTAALEHAVVSEILGDLEESRIPASYDYVVSRIVPVFDLATWSDPAVRHRAEDLLSRFRESFPEVLGAIERQLALAAPPEARVEVDRPLTLMSLAGVVDRSLVAGAKFPHDLVDEAKELVRGQMEQTKLAAIKGQFSGVSVSESDVAVALIFLADVPDLWPAVVDFLCDPRVQRDDKTRALNRIIRSPEKVSASARHAFATSVRELLVGGPAFLGPTIDPYPSAVGIAAMLGLIPGEELLSRIGTLLGSKKTHVRTEGVKILVAMASGGVEHAWLGTSVLLLTYDENNSVRASAAYALCRLRDLHQIGEQTVEDRIVALLRSDGVEVPSAVLAGLQQTVRPVSSGIRKVLAPIAASHASRSIRSDARSVLGDQS